MPSSPVQDQVFTSDIQAIDQIIPEGIHIHDELDLLPTTPSRPPSRKQPHSKSKKLTKWKGKRVRDLTLSEEGGCPLLDLPEDVVHTLLTHIPPRDLTRLAQTCKDLYEELEDESIWRQSYINRFLYDGAARSNQAKQDVKVLVQGCLNSGGRGWKKEALSRESMLSRWTDSKASMVIHSPPTGLIHYLSLSYPPFIPAPTKSLVVGKNHQIPTMKSKSPVLQPTTPIRTESTTPNAIASSSATPTEATSPTPNKLTHRQKYEALLAATTRPPPHVLSASLVYGGVVRSDPMSGKVSKGFWGPGRDANFHLRPHLDPFAEPSSLFLPTRTQAFILWGLKTGSCVHTTMQSKHHSTHGGRASSVNVHSEVLDSHQGEITDIWAPENHETEHLKWVTGGEDGRVKLWQFHPGSATRSGKRTPNEVVPAKIECLFSSGATDAPLENRSEASKRRQNGRPDPITFARFDTTHDVVCGVTVDGDLRIWFSASSDPIEVRVDVGSEEVEGGIKDLHLNVKIVADQVEASILIHHRRSPTLTRYRILQNSEIHSTIYSTPTGSSITAIHTSFQPTCPISAPSSDQRPSARITAPVDTSESISPIIEPSDPFAVSNFAHSHRGYGQFIMAGDEVGHVHTWAWDADDIGFTQSPIRSWEAMNGKVTALDYSCGITAVGSFDGYIKIFDPLPSPPTMLRTFHASRLSPGELLVAASEESDARYYTVNKLIVENDLVVASIGRKVFAWRAGSGKGRTGGKESGWKRTNGSRGDGKGSSRGLDMRAIHRAAVADNSDLEETPTKVTSRHEAREVQAMENMGLEGDDALQYALLLSMEEQESHTMVEEENYNEPSIDTSSRNSSTGVIGDEIDEEGLDEETREAIRQVEMYKKQEEEELNRVLEMIRLSEASESGEQSAV
ncbi:uncharacterized protein I206_105262 [Kwoniella pini CBS 10737]|uniref:F-box domain-containing protein n=1 Tax=Kwoniella pini CBS 10737 TaxID=1296096 RepID=A0A1B9I4Q0_9TREE|nr:uncharacterized protein I206_03829 [Kwoniella pini CBS 10737]OCF50505.1 hypothetical protein I206_03829 [Kwoniella pini CBS 10737]